MLCGRQSQFYFPGAAEPHLSDVPEQNTGSKGTSEPKEETEPHQYSLRQGLDLLEEN